MTTRAKARWDQLRTQYVVASDSGATAALVVKAAPRDLDTPMDIYQEVMK